MFRDITIKRAIIIFMMFTVLNLFLGCNDSKDITSPESSNEIVEYEQSNDNQESYDFTTCDGSNYQIFNPDVKYYSPGFDPNDRIYQVYYKSGVQKQIQYFEELGYEFRPVHSLIISGTVVPEGMTDTFEIEVVELVMAYIEDTMKQVAHVTYSECDKLGYFVQSSITSFVVPEDLNGFEEIFLGTDNNENEVYIYVKDFLPSIAYKATSSISTFSIDGYKRCMRNSIIAGCTLAAIGCMLSGPGWAACTANACVLVAAAAALACAADQLF